MHQAGQVRHSTIITQSQRGRERWRARKVTIRSHCSNYRASESGFRYVPNFIPMNFFPFPANSLLFASVFVIGTA